MIDGGRTGTGIVALPYVKTCTCCAKTHTEANVIGVTLYGRTVVTWFNCDCGSTLVCKEQHEEKTGT